MSLVKLEEHRRFWVAKPELAAVYAPWFDALLARLPSGARVLEVGAGPGFLEDRARRTRPDLRWVATELLPATWNDVVADALRLPFRSDCADAVVGLDLLHHLARPRRFLEESARVLRRRGQLLLIEPWVSAFSYPIYRWLHQEGCRLNLDPWRPFGDDKDAFEGDAAVAYRLLRLAGEDDWRACGLAAPTTELFTGFAWLLTLGFRRGSLLPQSLLPVLLAIERRCWPLRRIAGMRVLVRWERGALSAATTGDRRAQSS